jgi:hypothetical protein
MGQQLRTSANRSTPGRFAAAIPCGPGLDAQPRNPCAGMMHNPGTHGRKYAQPRNHGQQYADVCIHWANVCKPWPAVCTTLDPLRAGWQFDRVINAGPVLDAVPSMDPWASMMHNPGSHGQQLRTSANRSTPGRVATAIHAGRVVLPSSYQLRDGLQLRFPAGRVGSCDPWGPGWNPIE